MFTPIAKPERVASQPVVISDELRKTVTAIPTTSARIRYLHAKGYSKGNIAKMLSIRYQHVYNTIKTSKK